MYTELTCDCKEEYKEIIMAELAEIGFDSFMDDELESFFYAYIETANYDKKAVEELSLRYAQAGFVYTSKEIAKENWNSEWEKNYDPIAVEDQVFIRAHFHEAQPNFTHEIVITPKMSFGTGHHATTWQMVKLQLDIDHKDKSVLDVGCGTGILSIMAAKLGATKVRGFDIEEWAIENSIENAENNGFPSIQFEIGTMESLNIDGIYDIILANINKHVLTAEIPSYVDHLKAGGYLLLSGIYEHDIADIEAICHSVGLTKEQQIVKTNWAALVFRK
ncbi:50S ribosomal protein L11 methyltransferase [Peijinzhouia sedimentorum]